MRAGLSEPTLHTPATGRLGLRNEQWAVEGVYPAGLDGRLVTEAGPFAKLRISNVGWVEREACAGRCERADWLALAE